MEQTSFALTPTQQGILATLSRETGKPIPTLLDEALAVLQEQVRSGPDHGREADHEPSPPLAGPPETPQPIWEQFADAFTDVPEEDIARLPTDLAAQVDHYVYGLPKRPA